jgi:hypothetical protein
MTPQELAHNFDVAQNGPSLQKPPREIGKPRDHYRPMPRETGPNHFELVKHHMRNLTDVEFARMSREMRGNLRIRLCNDEVINALLRAWAQS